MSCGLKKGLRNDTMCGYRMKTVIYAKRVFRRKCHLLPLGIDRQQSDGVDAEFLEYINLPESKSCIASKANISPMWS